MFDPNVLEDFAKATHPTSPAVRASCEFYNNKLPSEPDEVCSITEMPGLPAWHVEEAFDRIVFQARFRAPRGNNAQARTNAANFDRRIMDDAIRPFEWAGAFVADVGRSAGPPAYLGTDHQGRANYFCNYYALIERL